MRQIMARQKKITLQMDPRNSRHCCFFFVKCTFIMALESKRPLVREKRVFSFDFPFILLERTSKRPALHVAVLFQRKRKSCAAQQTFFPENDTISREFQENPTYSCTKTLSSKHRIA